MNLDNIETPKAVLDFIEKYITSTNQLFNPRSENPRELLPTPEDKIPLIILKDSDPTADIILAFNTYRVKTDGKAIILLPAKVDEKHWIRYVQPFSLLQDCYLYFLGKMKINEPGQKPKKSKDGYALLVVGLDLLDTAVLGLAESAGIEAGAEVKARAADDGVAAGKTKVKTKVKKTDKSDKSDTLKAV